jgi:hypothetical protein
MIIKRDTYDTCLYELNREPDFQGDGQGFALRRYFQCLGL